MSYIMRWQDRPVITLTEAVMILGLSSTTIKRRIATGVIKAVERENLKHRILIYTDSLAKFLEKGGLA